MGAHSNRGALPGLVAPKRPERDDARELDGGAGIEVQDKADSQDFASGETSAEADKEFATMRAALALREFELHIVSDGAGGTMLLVQRWGHSRTLGSLADVRAFALQVGAMPC